MKHDVKFTRHAIDRIRQRAIPASAVETVIRFGERHHAQGGCKAYFMSRRAVEKHRRLRDIDLGVYADIAVIVSADAHIVTVQYCPAPKKSWVGRK